MTTTTKPKLGDYQRRCLVRLLAGPCERSKLDRYIGTTNSPEYIRQLRAKGLMVLTRKVKGFNRDGKAIWWGEYQIATESIVRARSLLDWAP